MNATWEPVTQHKIEQTPELAQFTCLNALIVQLLTSILIVGKWVANNLGAVTKHCEFKIFYENGNSPEVMARNAIYFLSQCQKQWSLSAIVVGFEEIPKEWLDDLLDVFVERNVTIQICDDCTRVTKKVN